MGLISKIQEFNNLVDRINKGGKYLDSGKANIKEIELFNGLVNRANELYAELKEMGYKLTSEECFYGIGRGDKNEH